LGSSDQNNENCLDETLARLWVVGAPVSLSSLQPISEARLTDLPTYPFRRVRHWIDPDEQLPAAPVVAASAAAPDGLTGETVDRSEFVQQQLTTLFEEISGLEIDQQDFDLDFSEFGLDSLILTQISIALQEEFRVELTFRELIDEHSTLAKLTTYLKDSAPELFESLDRTIETRSSSGSESLPHDSDPLSTMLHQLKSMETQLTTMKASGGIPGTSARPRGTVVASPIEQKHESKRRLRKPHDDRPVSVNDQTDLDPARAGALAAFVEGHAVRTAKSKAGTQRYRAAHADPRTASGFNRAWKEICYPLICDRSEGPHLWDIDGNRYIDLLSGFGPNLLGHGDGRVIEAVEQQLRGGFEIGPQSHLAGETAEMVCRLTGLERASFVCTGSEAVQAAIRCVRTYTRREKIVLFAGDYHGNFDEVLVHGANGKGTLRTLPSAPGIPRNNVEDIIVLDYGSENSLELIREIGDQLAGVMVEPVQSRCPEHQPRAFLHDLRAICTEKGAQLIFDEVVTGFRCHPGGAQAHFGVKADIATYGKVVGGNMPIGIVAGSSGLMDTFDGGMWQYGDDSHPEAGVTFFAGTFVRHPLSIAACNRMLSILLEEGPALQQTLAERTDRFAARLNALFQERELPIELPNFTSVMYLRNNDHSDLSALLWYYLRDEGLFALEGFPSYLTLAHTDEVLDEAYGAFDRATARMIDAGFYPKPRNLIREVERKQSITQQPPVPGARLGKDPQGNPTWYVKDKNQPERFVPVKVK
jgi:glutamate-1-semialdehyde aminotransferase/acyl carrier protein